MKFSRPPAVATALAATALLTFGVLAPALGAAASCGSSSFGQHYWGKGRNPSGASSSGAQATIEVRESALCNPPSGKVAQAAAFAGLFQAGGGGFAWVGWDRLTGEGRNGAIHISQTGSIETRTILGAVALGELFKYKATWQNGAGQDNKIHFIVCAANGTNCTDFGHTAFDATVWSDIQGRIAGNTNTKDADIPGIVGNRNDYTAIMWRDGTGSWTTTTSSNLTDSVTRYHLNVVDNTHIQTWTDPL
jgi:hypothetical protein